MKLHSIDSTATFAWNHGCLPLLATGTAAGAVDLNFSAKSSLEIYNIFLPTDKSAIFSAATDNRFNALAWSEPIDGRPQGVLVGAFEDGTVEFWDADVLIKTKDLSKASLRRSTHAVVKSLAFNTLEPHILVSGGAGGQILVWDIKTLAEPTIPGTAMTPMDEISCVAWNNSVSNIFASTSNNYTSIWDMKTKREVLHLSYNGELGRANFSAVAWHPTQSTKLITASDSDGCPLILTWDLRNANAPESIMKGHTKGVLSLDWCKKDPELLISSGKDNTTIIWNPITGQKLGEYPTTANWAFSSKFAPSAPDIFATASYDGKIIVQTLQDTSPPVVDKQKTQDESDFWNELATVETTQQPRFDHIQAPAWLKRPCSVNFGFGSKLVIVKTESGKSSIEINKVTGKKIDTDFSKALETNDFSKIIDEKVENSFDEVDKSDWELLKKLNETDNKSIFDSFIGLEQDQNDVSNDTNGSTKDDFFENLESKTFTGSFKLSNVADQKLTKLILSNKLDEAVDECIKQDKLTEALVLALDSNESIKSKVKKAFFNKDNSELSRIIYSASSKDIGDIVSNAEVDDWKLIANSITSYCTDQNDFNSKITELGDRIVHDNRDDAILCYLAGSAIDKISTIWLKELPDFESKLIKDSLISSPFDAHFNSLTNFAEKISAYRAITKTDGTLTTDNDASKVILEYSTLLANYGEFEIASKFSKLLPQGMDGFKEYNERIIGASTKPVVSNTYANGATTKKRYAATASAPLTNNTAPVSVSSSFGQSKPSAPPFTPSVPVGGSLRPNGYRPSVPSVPAAGIISPPTGINGGLAAPPTNIAPTSVPTTPGPIPPIAGHSNPYKPVAPASNPYAVHNPYMKPSPVATPVQAPPATQIPPKPKYKEVTDGWNDLPEAFKPKPEARRAAASAVSPAPTQFNNMSNTNTGLPPNGSKRPSMTSPPVAPAVGPPRVLSRTASRASIVSPRPSAANPYAPPASATTAPPTPYAPPTPGGPISAPPANPYGAPGNGSHVPAVNPYAPSASMSPAASVSPASNPYAPPPGTINPSVPSGPGSVVSPRAHNNQPIKNPYAPPPMQSASSSSRVPSGGVIPPKPIIAGPPMGNGSAYGAPPTGSSSPAPPPPPTAAAAAAIAASAAAAQEAAPESTKYPPGDRSHISSEDAPIYETFNKVYQELKPNIPEKYAKHGEDMEKRLNILYDHLNNDDLLTTEAKETLKLIASKLSAKDYGAAGAMILSFASSFPDEVGNWHTGVKRLINMAEALT